MIDARVYTDYRIAKKLAGELAISMRFELGQSPNGKPQVRTTTGRIKPFGTWLAAYTWLFAVWRDRRPKAKEVPVRSPPPVKQADIPWAILLE
jgi:hypothetical protein